MIEWYLTQWQSNCTPVANMTPFNWIANTEIWCIIYMVRFTPTKWREVIHIWLRGHLCHTCRLTNKNIPMSVDWARIAVRRILGVSPHAHLQDECYFNCLYCLSPHITFWHCHVGHCSACTAFIAESLKRQANQIKKRQFANLACHQLANTYTIKTHSNVRPEATLPPASVIIPVTQALRKFTTLLTLISHFSPYPHLYCILTPPCLPNPPPPSQTFAESRSRSFAAFSFTLL